MANMDSKSSTKKPEKKGDLLNLDVDVKGNKEDVSNLHQPSDQTDRKMILE
jgi:hypothetical protein